MSAARCRGGALSFGTIDDEVDSKLFFFASPTPDCPSLGTDASSLSLG